MMVDGLFFFLLYLVGFGMAMGWLAQVILEPRRRRNWSEAFVVGVIGSFVGGLVARFTVDEVFGVSIGVIIGAVLGSIAVLWIWQAIRGKRPFEQEHHREGTPHPGSGSHHDTRHPDKPGRKDKKARKR